MMNEIITIKTNFVIQVCQAILCIYGLKLYQNHLFFYPPCIFYKLVKYKSLFLIFCLIELKKYYREYLE